MSRTSMNARTLQCPATQGRVHEPALPQRAPGVTAELTEPVHPPIQPVARPLAAPDPLLDRRAIDESLVPAPDVTTDRRAVNAMHRERFVNRVKRRTGARHLRPELRVPRRAI